MFLDTSKTIISGNLESVTYGSAPDRVFGTCQTRDQTARRVFARYVLQRARCYRGQLRDAVDEIRLKLKCAQCPLPRYSLARVSF
jgi:hypothetical protein